jgi:demethylmenaquinone methyltransferase/2-methoxy-6-polyprenyl-1,4-benzoquinol methylase
MNILDVAMGTGLVAREAMKLVGPTGRVTGVDPSAGMLKQARQSINATMVVGVGQAIPFADASFDFVSLGYALRHLPDLNIAFSEFFRVLKPGGKVCILEISRPKARHRRALLKLYFKVVLPVLSRIIRTRPETRRLWTYYWETIDQCVPPETVIAALGAAGFRSETRILSLGLFSEFSAVKE